MNEKRTYYVANNNWELAWHDLTIEAAEEVLARELENDKENEQGREILDADDEE